MQTLDIHVDDKIIVEGYSAGTKFANCYTELHPEIVKACICGGNSGLGIIPLPELNEQILNFPLGIADVPNFDFEAFRSIPQLYYIGTEDNNDPATPEYKYKVDAADEYILDKDGRRIPKTDEKGKIISYVDSQGKMRPRYKENYTQEEVEIIQKILGEKT